MKNAGILISILKNSNLSAYSLGLWYSQFNFAHYIHEILEQIFFTCIETGILQIKAI